MRKYSHSVLSPVTSNCRKQFFFKFNNIWKKEQKHTTSEIKKKSGRWKACEIRLRKEIRTRNLSGNNDVEGGIISWVTPKWNAKDTSHGVMLLLSHQEDSGNQAHSNSQSFWRHWETGYGDTQTEMDISILRRWSDTVPSSPGNSFSVSIP